MKISTNLIQYKQYRDILYVVIILVLGSLWLKQCQKNTLIEESLINLGDSISVLVHKDGTKTFSTGVISTNANTFNKIKTTDPGIIALQKQVDNRTQSATFLESETRIGGLFKDSTTVSTPWMSGFISRTQPDSIKLDLKVKNDFIVSIREKGFIKRHVEVDVLSMNPFTEIGVLKTYTKPLKHYSIVIGPQIGFGLGFNAKELSISPSYYIGIGVTYPLIKL